MEKGNAIKTMFSKPWGPKLLFLLKVSFPYLLMLVASILPFIVWLKNPQYITSGDDITWHKVYVYDLVYGWRNGFSGISLGHQLLGNLGYNIYTFYAPFSHYLVGFLTFLGMRIIDAWKVVIIGSIFLSGVFTYRLAFLITKDKGIALAFGLAYIFSPYRLYNILYRAAFAESFAQGFIPLLLLGVYRILKEEKPRVGSYIMTIVGGAILILSHPFTALLTGLLAVGLILANFKNLIRIAKKRQTWIYLPVSLVLLFGLIAFYFVPMQQALNSGLYRMSDEEAVWTSIARLIKHLDGSIKFSGYLRADWLDSYSGTYPGETAATWAIDICLFVCLEALAIVVLQLMRKKGKKDLGLAIAVIVSLVPLFFSRREEVMFAVPLFTILMVFITLTEDQKEAKDRGLRAELLDLAKNPETYVLIVALIVSFLYLFTAFMWRYSPSLIRKGQFPFRFWSIINVIILLIAMVLAKTFGRYKSTKYVVAALAVLWYVVALGPVDKRMVYYNHSGNSAEPTTSYVHSLQKVGVMNEYMPNVFYEKHTPTYANSLYYTIRTEVQTTHKWQWGADSYLSPAILEGDASMNILSLNSPDGVFAVSVYSENALVQLPQFYYDGYVASSSDVNFAVDGIYVDGLVSFRLPKGTYTMNVNYIGPKSYRVFRPIFYVSVAGVLVFGLTAHFGPKIYAKCHKKPEEAEMEVA